MATRPLRLLILAALAIATLIAPGAAAAATTDAPTPLERVLQKRYLDRFFLLHSDVKVQQVKTQTVVSSTVGGTPKLNETKPITLVTEQGVFYTSNYDSKSELNLDVRAGPLPANAWDDPSLQNQALVMGGTVGSVVQIDRKAVVAIPQGYLARVVGVVEDTQGVQVLLEAFQGVAIPVLVRGAGTRDEPLEERQARFAALFARLCFELPDTREGRLESIDSAWSEAVQEAIRESRVATGMTPFQVVLAWGNPVFISRDADSDVDIWLYKRGATLLEQMRNPVNVYFASGRVAEIDAAAGY